MDLCLRHWSEITWKAVSRAGKWQCYIAKPSLRAALRPGLGPVWDLLPSCTEQGFLPKIRQLWSCLYSPGSSQPLVLPLAVWQNRLNPCHLCHKCHRFAKVFTDRVCPRPWAWSGFRAAFRAAAVTCGHLKVNFPILCSSTAVIFLCCPEWTCSLDGGRKQRRRLVIKEKPCFLQLAVADNRKRMIRERARLFNEFWKRVL